MARPDIRGNEHYQHAIPGSSLEELLIKRITAEAVRSPYDREVMNAEEAADFLRLSSTAFRRLAPTLPRCQIYERSGYRYLRSDLLAWLRGQCDSHVDSHQAAPSSTRAHKKAPPRGVTRLV